MRERSPKAYSLNARPPTLRRMARRQPLAASVHRLILTIVQFGRYTVIAVFVITDAGLAVVIISRYFATGQRVCMQSWQYVYSLYTLYRCPSVINSSSPFVLCAVAVSENSTVTFENKICSPVAHRMWRFFLQLWRISWIICSRPGVLVFLISTHCYSDFGFIFRANKIVRNLYADTYADAHVSNTAMETGAAASLAATNKTNKYSQLSTTHIFTPVATETAGT